MRWNFAGIMVVAVLIGATFGSSTASAATCSDYPNQAAAQRAADTRDADGDGIYCEALPCPCATGGGGSSTPSTPSTGTKQKAKKKKTCASPRSTVKLYFSADKYPNIKAHMDAAIAKGWPKIMVLNRKGAGDRRDRLMDESPPTQDGMDRDEYPAAIGRGRKNGNSKGLIRGTDPRGWMADVAFVPSSENRSHGASLGNKLRKYCNGIKFRYVFE